MTRLTKATAAGAVAVSLLLAACSSGESGGESTGGSPGGSASTEALTLGAVVPPATFEAANMNWGNQSIFAQAVYDSLLKADPNGLDVHPSLATEWSYDEAGTLLTMTLRDDVVFTDGTPFTAEVAAANLLRFKNGTSPQRVKAADMADARAVDGTTLEIQLTRPNPAFLIYLTQVMGMQESPEAFESADVQTNPVGSGPYVLDTDATVVGTSYAFSRNPDYWDAESYPYESLDVNVYTDGTSLVNAIRGGQLNASATTGPNIVPEIESAGFDLHPNLLQLTGIMLFDRGGQVNPALGEVQVRQAINHAIDKEAFLEAQGMGYGKLDDQIFRESSNAWDESLNDAYPYDPDRARELLAEAGYADGFDLVMPTAPAFPAALTALITQQLGEVGINATFQDVGQNLIADILGGKFAASYFTLQQDPNEFQTIDFLISPNATWNPFRYEDPTVNELIETARTGDEAAAEKALKDLNAYVVDQAWFAKWYTGENVFVTDGDTDVTVNQGNAYPYLWDFAPES